MSLIIIFIFMNRKLRFLNSGARPVRLSLKLLQYLTCSLNKIIFLILLLLLNWRISRSFLWLLLFSAFYWIQYYLIIHILSSLFFNYPWFELFFTTRGRQIHLIDRLLFEFWHYFNSFLALLDHALLNFLDLIFKFLKFFSKQSLFYSFLLSSSFWRALLRLIRWIVGRWQIARSVQFTIHFVFYLYRLQ